MSLICARVALQRGQAPFVTPTLPSVQIHRAVIALLALEDLPIPTDAGAHVEDACVGR